MAVGYPDEVWKAIKGLWEVSPKNMGWRLILAQVADAMKCEVPSIVSASSRANKEKWRKKLKKDIKNGLKSDLKKMEDLNTPEPLETQVKSIESANSLKSKNDNDLTPKQPKKVTGEIVEPTGVAVIDNIIKENASTAERMIGNLRRQGINIFNIQGRCTEALTNVLDEYDDMSRGANAEEIEAVGAKLSVIERAAQIADNLSKANERTTKLLVALNGLEPDDFKDRETALAQRTEQMAALDDKLEEVKRQMATDSRAALMRDITAIEEGNYERVFGEDDEPPERDEEPAGSDLEA